MGRAPCCSKVGLHKGPWTPREDALLTKYIQAHGEGQWKSLPKKAGLLRCGKSCRLRWMNYLRPDIKRGNITPEEDDLIIRMHSLLGNRWSLIAGRLPGRTDNEIKNYWNTHLCKKMRNQLGTDQEEEEEEPSSGNKKKKTNGKKKNKQKKKDKKNKATKDDDDDDEEPQKTKVYLPKPIRVKPLTLLRSDSTFTFDSNNNSAAASSSSQENNDNKVESPEDAEIKEEMMNNMVCEVGGNLGENDGFDFFGEDQDMVNESGVVEYCQPYFTTDDHGTLEKLYDEYFQLLNMEDYQYDLDSFAESLLV
ncbi:hypothetical protein RIF29_16507 [Crotalaria pallida]|uniref:Uncharacterized protein n=1 Tax=Crotalaria pallida TaxID=3830 RepID=A0AAN9FHF3_CROPI